MSLVPRMLHHSSLDLSTFDASSIYNREKRPSRSASVLSSHVSCPESRIGGYLDGYLLLSVTPYLAAVSCYREVRKTKTSRGAWSQRCILWYAGAEKRPFQVSSLEAAMSNEQTRDDPSKISVPGTIIELSGQGLRPPRNGDRDLRSAIGVVPCTILV